ncbi:macrophage mannose receptor 1-like [Polypterus senegalus]|uniref:macrophage mannose receptor 1-like n=1 Tax=Polypterus senegalus TaxID=55291 RepID=UPI0019657D30|nr:macrophage mannose receptor 1-like [Polypterus senegalus]
MKQFPRKEVSIMILFLLTCRVDDGNPATALADLYSSNGIQIPGLSSSVLNVVSNVTVWHEAYNYCRKNSSDPAAVSAVNQLMQKLNISGKDNFCTYLSFYEVKWQWSNKDAVTYSNWKRNFFCGFVQSDGTWNDSVCDDQKTFMCYKETINISERYVWINSTMNWKSAQNYCREKYKKDLVSIRNESENQEIMEKAQGSPFWIGLFNNPWKWSDGENSTFQIWSHKQPDNYCHNEACVEILSDGTWNDAFCGKMNYFFCTNKSKVTTPFDLVNYSLSWLDAQRYCRNNYTDLMTVESQTENQNLKTPHDKNYWIGLRRENDNWQWSNRSPLTYTNWKREFSCAVLQSDGSWNDSDCSEEKPFMCYNETEYNHTYIWINKSMNWTRALNYCQKTYTDLVSIRNESENEEIRKKAQNMPFWIGLFKNSSKWSDDEKSTLTNNSNQSQLLDNEQHPENCTEVKIKGCCVITQYSTEKHLICSQVGWNLTLVNDSSTWEEAVDYCRNKNSNLIRISSEMEQNIIATLVNTTNSSNVWLGLRQSRVFGF